MEGHSLGGKRKLTAASSVLSCCEHDMMGLDILKCYKIAHMDYTTYQFLIRMNMHDILVKSFHKICMSDLTSGSKAN